MNLDPKNNHERLELAKVKARLEREIKTPKESEKRLRPFFEHVNEAILVAQYEEEYQAGESRINFKKLKK